ncbi:ABC transporter ATP-binding protein [Nocardiopsis alborubida]|uniref:ABC transporter ATP-binding protein n=1 Tax=Nocardiopsis alborubida TaxID=146802 RepID=A0A7X6RTX9_9ACTN|nr:ABC transporter ATP-binding protein [Nocardiopsis alborubida]NKZ02129.1 ABC transporter ATP-binding protein [Nocardiopsis alborubida]
MRISNRGKLRSTTDHSTAPRPPLVEFHDVSLTHDRTRHLDHLDLTLHPGEHVALVGLTHEATTALTRLLTGQSAPTRGRLATHTRAHILTPRPTLAHTITGQSAPDTDDPHLAHALAHTRLDTHRLHTPLDALPPALLPRIHQARALYAQRTNTRLLVLTDPPAHDHACPPTTPDTGLLTLTRQPTLARTADRILLLYKGRVTETGTHHQLLVRGGAYARLYALTGIHRTAGHALG